MRRAHALNAAAFLVDKYKRVSSDRGAQIAIKTAHLVRRFDITGKENKGPRVSIAKKRGFICG